MRYSPPSVPRPRAATGSHLPKIAPAVPSAFHAAIASLKNGGIPIRVKEIVE